MDPGAVVVGAVEAADASVELVVRTAAGFEWRSEGGAPVVLDVPEAATWALSFDEEQDAFVLRAPDAAAIVWSPARGSDERYPAPAAPEGSAGWIRSGDPGLPFAEIAAPNPAYAEVRVPERYVVARWGDGALQDADAHTTPCAARSRCRLLGESYLLGVVGGLRPTGVYAFWSWESLVTLVSAPLFWGGGR